MSNLKATVEIRCLRASTHHKIITSGIIERKQVFLRSNFSHCLCGEFKQTHYSSSTQDRTLLHHTLFCQLFYGLVHLATFEHIIKLSKGASISGFRSVNELWTPSCVIMEPKSCQLDPVCRIFAFRIDVERQTDAKNLTVPAFVSCKSLVAKTNAQYTRKFYEPSFSNGPFM